jgi:hypothetical protein
MRRILTLTFALGLLGGIGSLDGPTQAGDPDMTAVAAPVCPKIYAPVICDNGKIYPNQCVADRHHAKNCIPTGDL